jgi:hypothetical protein
MSLPARPPLSHDGAQIFACTCRCSWAPEQNQSVYGIGVNESIATDAIHPLVNCGHNTPIADSMLFNIGHLKEKIEEGAAGLGN